MKTYHIPIGVSTAAMFSLIALSFAYRVKAKEFEKILGALKAAKEDNQKLQGMLDQERLNGSKLQKMLDGMNEPATERSVLEAQESWKAVLGTTLTHLCKLVLAGVVTFGASLGVTLGALNLLHRGQARPLGSQEVTVEQERKAHEIYAREHTRHLPPDKAARVQNAYALGQNSPNPAEASQAKAMAQKMMRQSTANKFTGRMADLDM